MLDFEVAGLDDFSEENITNFVINLKSALATVLEVDEALLKITLVNQTTVRSLPSKSNVEFRVQVIVTNELKRQHVLDLMDPGKFPEEVNNMIVKDPLMANKGISIVKSYKPIVVAEAGMIQQLVFMEMNYDNKINTFRL